MKRVTWLHLSDLHIGRSDKDIFKQNIIIDALVSDIKEQIKEHNLKIDFVFVSGDVSFRGSKEELVTAESVLKSIASAAEVDCQNVFIVPGNHDIVRSNTVTQTLLDYKANRNSKAAYSTEMPDAFSKSLYNYTSFVNHFCERTLYNEDDLFYEARRNISGKEISILGLNTAWSAVMDVSAGEVMLGEYQVRKTLQAAENSDIIIALMHHPFSWLSEEDNYRAKGLLSKRADFILTGHIHTVSDIGQLSMFGNAFCVTSGAIYDESCTYSNSYNITTCDLESGTGKIYFRQFVEAHGGYWSVDNTIDQSVPDGIVSFQLPSRIQIDNDDEQRFFQPTLPVQAHEKEYIENMPVPKIPKALIDDIKNGNCYLFAGAGVSVNAGLPSWLELLSNGIDELRNRVSLTEKEQIELQNLLLDGKMLIVADYLRYRLGERWFSDYIKKYLATKGRRSRIHEILSKIPFKIMITTNYDDFIERTTENSKVLLPDDLSTDGYEGVIRVLENGDTPVIKLHGTYDKATSIVFGDSEYCKLLYNSDNYRKSVKRLMSEKSCFFVGFGFSDMNILAFLQSIHETKGSNAPKHYAIMKRMGTVMERYFRDRLNIEPIFIDEYAQVDILLYQIRDSI